jgi:hypothetical protein
MTRPVTQGVSLIHSRFSLVPVAYPSNESLTPSQGRLGLSDYPRPCAPLSDPRKGPPRQLGVGRQTRIHRR